MCGFLFLGTVLARLETEPTIRSNPSATAVSPVSSQTDSTPFPGSALLDFYLYTLITKGVLHLVLGENVHFWAQGCGSVVDHLPSTQEAEGTVPSTTENEGEIEKGKEGGVEGGKKKEGFSFLCIVSMSKILITA